MLESLVCERWGGWGWAPGPRGVWCSFVMQKTQTQRNRPTTGTDPRRTPEPTHGTHPRNPPTEPTHAPCFRSASSRAGAPSIPRRLSVLYIIFQYTILYSGGAGDPAGGSGWLSGDSAGDYVSKVSSYALRIVWTNIPYIDIYIYMFHISILYIL